MYLVVQGQTVYEWIDGFFLIQHVELGDNKGMEVIGHERKYGQSSSEEIKSRYYDSTGSTFDYVYELEGDTLMIWFGEKGTPAYYRGSFCPDGNTLRVIGCIRVGAATRRFLQE